MTSVIESLKPNDDVSNFCTIAYPHDILIGIIAENVLIALEWEAWLVRAFFDLNNAVAILRAIGEESFAQLKRPEAIINEKPWEKIDARDTDVLKTARQASKKQSGGKKKKRTDGIGEKKRKQEGRPGGRKSEEQERLRRWEERWERKLRAEEELDDAKCCMDDGFTLKPKTQSSIWINVTQDRTTQEIQMAFKHAPIPRPKPPPLPQLRREKTPENVSMERKISTKLDKKSGRGGFKKKK